MPWILKVIGISALARVGGSSARPMLGQYAADTGPYLEFSTASDDPEAALPVDPETKRFDALVTCALHEIDVREGRAVAGSPPRVTQQFMSFEEMSKLWSALRARFRPSVAYEVSSVTLSPEGW